MTQRSHEMERLAALFADAILKVFPDPGVTGPNAARHIEKVNKIADRLVEIINPDVAEEILRLDRQSRAKLEAAEYREYLDSLPVAILTKHLSIARGRLNYLLTTLSDSPVNRRRRKAEFEWIQDFEASFTRRGLPIPPYGT